MSVTERHSYTKSSFKIPPPSENVLLAVIAVAFLVLHIAAGLILQNALMTPGAALEETTAALHD